MDGRAYNALMNQCWGPEFPARALKVYLVLFNTTIYQTDYSWHTYKEISQQTGLSRKQVQKDIKNLVDSGYVSITRNQWGGNQYHITGKNNEKDGSNT